MRGPIESSAPGLELPRGFSFWTSTDMLRERGGVGVPSWTVGEAAKLFYGYGSRWLYARLAEIDMARLGWVQRVSTPQLGGTTGYRFNLHNIELLTHALLERHAIDGRRASAAITIVKATAILHGFHEEIERKERARG